MRAVTATTQGTVERAGASLAYDVYGTASPTILLVPTWEIIHSRAWKMQIGYLARHFRVITYDAAGTGRSSRPYDPTRYPPGHRLADAVAILDATGTNSCVAVGFSASGATVLDLAALHPKRVLGVVPIAASTRWRVPSASRMKSTVYDPVTNPAPDGWGMFNTEYWKSDWPRFIEFFMSRVNSDPHSTKAWDDCVEWGLEQEPEVLAYTVTGEADLNDEDIKRRLSQLDIPVSLIHGTEDQVSDYAASQALLDLIPTATLLTVDGASHTPHTRFPVIVNHAILALARRAFSTSALPPADLSYAWHIAPARPAKALYLSSPIGLGHSRRDLAIAQELRALRPDVQIDWLAQDPVTRVLASAGETIHPASAALAGESAHLVHESGEHNLAVFQALRTMDEILLHNFMVFEEVANSGQYDLVIADESWEVDHYLFENPSLKRWSFAWMTDFVGYLPMPSRGAREAEVTADYNLEMIEHVARFGRVRDSAVFVGDPDDIVDATFGPGLPQIRPWTEHNFVFSGYITGYDPASLGERAALRKELGYHDDELVCIVAVGGSGVGVDLLRRVVAGDDAAGQGR